MCETWMAWPSAPPIRQGMGDTALTREKWTDVSMNAEWQRVSGRSRAWPTRMHENSELPTKRTHFRTSFFRGWRDSSYILRRIENGEIPREINAKERKKAGRRKGSSE